MMIDLGQITGLMIGTMDSVFFPLTVFQPIISLLIFSAIITVLVIVLNRFSVNRTLVKEMKNKMEQIRENLTQAQKQGNKEDINKYLSELMKVNGEYMRQTTKTLIISMVVLIVFLPWLNYKYGTGAVVTLPFTLPVIGSSLTWILWYALVSFTVGWVIKKLLGLDYA